MDSVKVKTFCYLDTAFGVVPNQIKEVGIGAAYSVMASRMRAHFSRFVKPGNLVFDVGANMGHYTQVFCDLGARVVAVDPQPICVRRLEDRYENDGRITVVGKGLADKPGELTLFASENFHTTASFSSNWKDRTKFGDREGVRALAVPVTTLDQLILEHGVPDFVKIDVEGFEGAVLSGLSQPVGSIMFEYALDDVQGLKRSLDAIERLGEARYNFSRVHHYIQSFRLDSERWLTRQELETVLLNKNSYLLFGDVYAQLIIEN
jgi:FkbM family methyltransferase